MIPENFQTMIGQIISHYRIDAELGKGGMGVVYRAHDQRLRRDVAIKVLSGAITDHGERRTRILAEARAASALSTHHTWHHVAAAYAVIGKPTQAAALLRRASAFGLPNYPAFRDDPFLAPLHNYAPFLRLMADLKREWSTYQREFGRQ